MHPLSATRLLRWRAMHEERRSLHLSAPALAAHLQSALSYSLASPERRRAIPASRSTHFEDLAFPPQVSVKCVGSPAPNGLSLPYGSSEDSPNPAPESSPVPSGLRATDRAGCYEPSGPPALSLISSPWLPYLYPRRKLWPHA